MSKFEILCVTMHQKDFSKIEEMNIDSDVVFANQADNTSYQECSFGEHRARMITTDTRGVGINRNLALMYAQGDICLFADDDAVYDNDMEQRVLAEFDSHPDADIMIFHLDTDSERKQKKYHKTKRCQGLFRMPWACFRIAFRRNSVQKANVWFTTLFGGGCIFPSGEDSMWLKLAKEKGLRFYVSKETIGRVSFQDSTWFTGYDSKFFFGKGAYYQATHPKSFLLWMSYFLLRTRTFGELPVTEKKKWMQIGRSCYKKLESYQEYVEKQ